MTESDLRAKLKLLREGRIPDAELSDVLHEYGEADFREAEAEVTQFLEHPSPHLRHAAVNVLTFHWRSPKHLDKLGCMLFDDPDEFVRQTVASGLGAVLEGSKDAWGTQLLVQKLREATEERFVREAAYEALLAIAVPELATAHTRAKTSLDRLATLVRERERDANARIKAGARPEEEYAKLDQEWDTWIDWDLVGAIERGEVT
jgi:HEAT repeat protein